MEGRDVHENRVIAILSTETHARHGHGGGMGVLVRGRVLMRRWKMEKRGLIERLRKRGVMRK